MAYTFPEITFRKPADEATPVATSFDATSFDIGAALRALPVLDWTVGEPEPVIWLDPIVMHPQDGLDCDAMRWADDGGRC